MDFHTKSYKSPDPEVPIQSLYICINHVTQTVSLGCLWVNMSSFTHFIEETRAPWGNRGEQTNGRGGLGRRGKGALPVKATISDNSIGQWLPFHPYPLPNVVLQVQKNIERKVDIIVATLKEGKRGRAFFWGWPKTFGWDCRLLSRLSVSRTF